VRQPWRMACAWVAAAHGEGPELPATLRGRVSGSSWRQVAELVRTGVASPPTSSAGRLCDAVAALCGVRAQVNYEGQAAVELEAVADPLEGGAYPVALRDEPGGPLVMDPRPAIRALTADLCGGAQVATVAARFYNGLAAATAAGCELAAARAGVETIVLSGGVFQNRLLLTRTSGLLADAGLHVLVPEQLPPNDGGIAYGQLAVAAARVAAEDGGDDVRA